MSYSQHFFIRARPGAVRQPDCRADVTLRQHVRQSSLTERHRYGAVARYRSDTGSEPYMTSGNSWEKRQVCGIVKIEIGTQLFVEVKLCAACRIQQVVCKSSRSKRRGARCIGDRVGVLPNGSMHPDVPASTIDFLVVQLTGGLRTTRAVHRYCLNLRPSGAECPHTRNPVGHVQGWPVPALSRQEEGQYDPHRVDWMDHLLGSTSSRRGSHGFFLARKS